MSKTRKWMALSAVPLLLVFFYGCSHKKPATPAPPEMKKEVVEKPATPVAPPKEPETSDMQEQNPLASEDLRVVNEALVKQGFAADVYFDFDKSDLKPEARDNLASDAQILKQHPEFDLTIAGHCDERGTNEYNLALGERRANAAKDYLVSLGVDAARLKTISYGEERPVCTDHNESCWWRNRRAHLVVTGRR